MTNVELGTTIGTLSRVQRASARGMSQSHTRTRQGLIVYAAAALAAPITAPFVADQAGMIIWPLSALVAVLMAVEYVSLQPYERLRSLRPAKHLLVMTGAGLLGASALSWATPETVRALMFVIGATAAVLATGVAVTTMSHRTRSILVVGSRISVAQFIEEWGARKDLEIRGICLAERPDEDALGFGIPVMGTLGDVASVALRLDVDQVVVAPGPLLTSPDVRRLSWAMEETGIELSVASEIHGAASHRIRPRIVGHRVVLSVRPGRAPAPVQWVKTSIDRIGAAGLLLLLGPIMAVIAVVIRRDSPGSALFKQTRTGIGGKQFTMFKFRTMVFDAEALLAELLADNEAAGPMFKMARDPRTTKVGRLLRRTSVDELPQLFNVLRGEMSLIGPRPCLPAESDHYDDWVSRRFRVKPGMTGKWQVSGRSNLSWDDSVRLDIDYTDNWTIREDFQIAALTARAVLLRDGAL